MNNTISSATHALRAEVLPTTENKQRPVPQTIMLHVVVPNGHVTGSMYLLSLEASDSSEEILNKLRHFYTKSLTSRWTRLWSGTILCRKMTIETAVLKRESTTPTFQTYPTVVIFPDSTPSKLLTSAFHQRSLPPTPLLEGPANALVLRPAFDQTRLWYMLAFALAMAPVAAIVTAWHTKKVDTGISMCICIFVMISTVQAIVAWSQVL